MGDNYDELFQIFFKQAGTLGIEKENCGKYVSDCFERLERQRQREEKQKERETEIELERERAEVEKEKTKQKEIEKEIELERERTKQKELDARNRDNADTGHDSGTRSKHSVGAKPVYPKLPIFKEKQDDVDSYLYRFETHATALGWEKEKWVTYLSALLEGNALTLYHSLASNGEVAYDVLKENLLKKFQCTAEGFRKKFREAKPDSNEPFQTYGIELTRLLDRWIALAGVSKNTAGIMNLVLGEQFLESVCQDLATFIRERGLVTLDDMVKAAESYRIARPGKNLARKASATLFASVGAVDEEEFENAAIGYSDQRGTRQEFRGRGGYQQTNLQHNFDGRSDQARGRFWRNRSGRGNKISGYPGSENCPLCDGKGHSSRQCPLRNSQNPCTVCGIGGHVRKTCPFVLRKSAPSNSDQANGNAAVPVGPDVVCAVLDQPVGQLHLEMGSVNTMACSVLRDTGATTCGVRRRLVTQDQYMGGIVRCKTFGGEIHEYPQAKVLVSCPYFVGELVCCVLEDPVADLIVGNVPGLSKPHVPKAAAAVQSVAAVTTRAQAKKKDLPHKPLVQVADDLSVTCAELIQLQKGDSTLRACFGLADTGEVKTVGSATYTFYIKNGVLYRLYQKTRQVLHQVVVPEQLRPSVMVTAHDQLLAGHCGTRRTLARILSKFFWPGVSADVSKYVHTCDICQKTVSRGKVPPVPLASMPLISTPFQKVAIDLVGPLSPPSEEGHRYILTLIDLATRFPEAVPLKDISSVAVAEALLSIFARLGFPQDILSDQGSQFNSDLMKQFHALCGTRAIRTSPYHPQANGTVERFHGTLKAMLKKVIHSQPRAWHRYLPALLFACRELPSESTGFSPFELMFGRKPRGPVALLADSWTDDTSDDSSSKSLYSYIFELKNIISESCEIAKQNSAQAAGRSKMYFDRRAKPRSFSVDDEVLVLLPTSSNKLLMSWSGPYRVQECFHPDYRVLVKGKPKVFHANMLKQYCRRANAVEAFLDQDSSTTVSMGRLVSWSSISNLFLESEVASPSEMSGSSSHVDIREDSPSSPSVPSVAIGVVKDDDDSVSLPTIPLPMTSSMTDEDISVIDFDKDLSHADFQDLYATYADFTDRLTTKPGAFNGDLFLEVSLTTDVPVRRRPYELPFSSRQVVEREVKVMLDLGVIEKSKSAYAAPVVLVQKKDASCRFCIDYRGLNKVTNFDAEPIPDVDELFTRLAASTYFTRIDLSKGYWQIVVSPVDRHKTAFATHMGLFQWVRMPFGLISAPAVFARMMRMLVLDEVSALNFFDDILVHSCSFKEHLLHVRGVLLKLRQYNLTARPSKISTGYKSLEFLGHVVGQGLLRPEKNKIKKILAIPTPTTRKQVRSLLGLLSFYRRYVAGFADLTAPISNLTKNAGSRTIAWTPACEEALQKIKTAFSTAPVLQLPRLDQPFVLRTDASGVGLGAVLMQDSEGDGTLHPCCYASRKLLERETRYSTIERECLAIVWGIQKFGRYLWGTQFILQTDHRPLTYLTTSRFKNARIMRWSLSLQEYKFEVQPLPGTSNTFADLLSRADRNQTVP